MAGLCPSLKSSFLPAQSPATGSTGHAGQADGKAQRKMAESCWLRIRSLPPAGPGHSQSPSSAGTGTEQLAPQSWACF